MNNESNYIDPIGLLPKIFAAEATPSEQRLVSEWLSADKENQRIFESFRQLWNLTGPVKSDDINIEAEWSKMEKSITPVRKLQSNAYSILKIAAAVILISVLAYSGIRSAMFKTINSTSTEIANYDLPDGSKVFLNAGSKIIYKRSFGTSNRFLVLKGEAFFEVMKSNAPFVIEAGNANVTVTGTKFNVNAYPDKEDIKVTVTEGTVKLSPADHVGTGIDLKEGETGVFNKSEKSVTTDPSDNMNAVAWKTGIMEFNRATLKNVTEVLENTYHIPFSVDTAVMNCTITVRFENQKADSVLKVLRSTLDLNITRKGRKVLITGTGC
jgi:ferric-dicitrate binding protein FerR (iron transport regulator)